MYGAFEITRDDDTAKAEAENPSRSRRKSGARRCYEHRHAPNQLHNGGATWLRREYPH